MRRCPTDVAVTHYLNADGTISCHAECAEELQRQQAKQIDRLREAIQEVWESVPATLWENDPMVQRHAKALTRLGEILREGK